MAYNVYDDAQKIYRFKQQYDKAKASGDTGLMTNAANSAKQLRDRMAQNGYGDLAKQFEGYNTQQMGDYLKYYPTQGKSSFRDYLKGSKLVTEYGYTPEQIDKMIGFNNATKEITFGGQNIGKADTIVDGVSYFSNDFMDGVIDNHLKHSGVTPKVGSTSSENVQKLLGIQYNDRKGNDTKREALWSEAMANPFETDIGKAIMGDYKLKAMQGRDNEAASGAASNSGNIDSFAAANALRQQASLTAMGQQQAIAAQTARISDLRGALGDIVGTQQIENQGALSTIGKQADLEQRDFDNKQAEKLADHQVNLDMATALGYEPKAWATANNPYFGDDGMLLNPATDFGTIIKNAQEQLKTATNSEEIKRLNNTINDASFARQFKVNNYPEYGKYAGEVTGYNPRRTLEGETLDTSNKLAERELAIKAADKYSSGVGSKGSGLTKSEVTTALKNGEVNEYTVGLYNDYFDTDYSVENPPAIAYSNLDEDEIGGMISDESDTEEWDSFVEEFDKESVRNFLSDYILPIYLGESIDDEDLQKLILAHTEEYDIDTADARKIVSRFGGNTQWVSGYTDRWGFNNDKGMKENK